MLTFNHLRQRAHAFLTHIPMANFATKDSGALVCSCKISDAHMIQISDAREELAAIKNVPCTPFFRQTKEVDNHQVVWRILRHLLALRILIQFSDSVTFAFHRSYYLIKVTLLIHHLMR